MAKLEKTVGGFSYRVTPVIIIVRAKPNVERLGVLGGHIFVHLVLAMLICCRFWLLLLVGM